jgi:hypothetical protein
VPRDLKADIHEIDEAQEESWWKRLIEGDAQALAEHYRKLASNMNAFIVRALCLSLSLVSAFPPSYLGRDYDRYGWENRYAIRPCLSHSQRDGENRSKDGTNAFSEWPQRTGLGSF